MKKINNAIASVEKVVGSIMLISIVLLIFVSAVARVIKHPIPWSVEASQLMFIWISMIGADLALKNRAHMGVNLLVRMFPKTIQNILALFSYVICSGFLCFMAYWGTTLCITNYLRTYAALKITYSSATVAIPFISVLMILTIIEQVIDLFKNWNTENAKA